MFKNYLKIALRNIMKYKIYSLINILGLTVGMASCLLILMYVHDELSYDTYNKKADQIYRVTREWFNSDGSSSLHLGHVAPPIAALLKNDFPDVRQAVRMTGARGVLVRTQDKAFQESNFFFADPEIFQVFTLPILSGEKDTPLADPKSIVISPEIAEKYFGNENPIGKVLNVDNQIDLRIAAVMAQMPANSHFHAEIFGSMDLLQQFYGEDEFKNWGSNNYATYLLLPPDYQINNLANEMPAFIGRHHPDGKEAIGKTVLHFQRLADIHLHSHLDSEIEANGNILYVYIFSAVAFFLLLIACVNFMNLATARSVNRAREVGLRKVVGAERTQLIRQFLGESVIMSIISLILALVVVQIALPSFNNFVGKNLSLHASGLFFVIASVVAIVLLVGVGAGSYPALFLTRFQPVAVLKGQKLGLSRSYFRSALVVFQFTTSIILIIGMGIVYNQLDYCRTKDLGLNKQHILVLPADQAIMNNYKNFRNQLLQHPGIANVAASKRVPSARLLDSSGSSIPDGDQNYQLEFRIANVRVDHNFIDTYGMTMAAGRNFSIDYPTDSTEAFILNETAVRKIGWPSPEYAVGKAFHYDSRKGHIIGVVKDFNYESLHQPVTPIVMLIAPRGFNSISVKINPVESANLETILAFLQQKWQEVRPSYPFTYSFLDARYDQLYRGEHRLGEIFGIFSMLAVFIACLGLFGLASYMAEQRTKEIGVRKVLGSSVTGIIGLLSRDFIKLVIFANLLAWPLAWIAMHRWLENFAYRIDMSPWMFALSGGIALLIALITVSWQAVRAAVANPVESLRYE